MPLSPYTADTICALSTPHGTGAIAIVRLSGPLSQHIIQAVFKPASKQLDLTKAESHKQYFGTIVHKDEIIDEVLVSLFRAPHSYTGEDAAEISCHGSTYIQQQLLEILLFSGARLAEPGEFTMRAYLNGRFDLAQAEAVADLIASQSRNAHALAMNQMRGGFSSKIAALRAQLVDFASLIALELDFSEEDVEFADRAKFFGLLAELRAEISLLLESFRTGNAIKNGIPVAIIGKPNVGKSTLLNAILNEERAIVSEIPGTTRDVIEDTIVIDGYNFRFIDTAGLRDSEDLIESMGIERTWEKIRQATVILYVCDLSSCQGQKADDMLEEFRTYLADGEKHFILVGNKTDMLGEIPAHFREMVELETIFVSAKRKENINLISESLVKAVKQMDVGSDAIVSNTRHFQALKLAQEALDAVEAGFRNKLPTDLATVDIRTALYHLGSITGEISSDEILGNIFGKFCIGK
ncbi:MAG: tRNA uridine-5-carboxymethylaminomethyl(34) synthesis GTPase MnmE [Bacteroidales bacterium]|nr:tRNA uridine-5-carboxymethylaminomethyl(34) synthesis GTPase MnmE [Bacteroidales bacterium]